MGPKKGPDGKLAIAFPMGDKKLPGIAAEDIGRCALGIFKRGREFIGKTVGSPANTHLRPDGHRTDQALGQEVRCHAVTPETYRAFGYPSADDLGDMFQFKRDFNDIFSAGSAMRPSRGP